MRLRRRRAPPGVSSGRESSPCWGSRASTRQLHCLLTYCLDGERRGNGVACMTTPRAVVKAVRPADDILGRHVNVTCSTPLSL